MKIYKTILEAKESDITSLAGIYFFRNKINNRYYIGQALNIKTRFKSHWNKIINKDTKYPIYRAITKYTIENFEFGIIGVIKNTNHPKKLIKKKLDELEITDTVKLFDSIEEMSKYINISTKTLSNTINRCIRKDTVYKKTYKFRKYEI